MNTPRRAGTMVIAEVGSCHDNDLDNARRLIAVAKIAGCDAVKFQFWSSAKRLAARRHAPEYESIYRAYTLPEEWLEPLRKFANEAGLEFMCTAYLPEDIHVVAPHVNYFKVASFEAGDTHFIDLHKEFRKPVIVSTGMMAGPEARDVYGHVAQMTGAMLHCVSAYPCPTAKAGLGGIEWLRNMRDQSGWGRLVKVGYSDHTADVRTGGLAVAAGAEVIEFHIRLHDTETGNPDFATALDPDNTMAYMHEIRRVEPMFDLRARKEPQDVEQLMSQYRVR